MIVNVDRKTRGDQSVDPCQGSGRAVRSMSKLASDSASAASGTTNLGALLKAKLNEQK
jgi:small subunit ribosomal protein S1